MKVHGSVIDSSLDRLGSCRGWRHAAPARLGQTDGAEWWHCRRCGAVWNLDEPSTGHRPASPVPEAQRAHLPDQS